MKEPPIRTRTSDWSETFTKLKQTRPRWQTTAETSL